MENNNNTGMSATIEQPADSQPQAAEQQPQQKVTFSPEQQSKIDEILRKAHGRFSRELQAENERLRQELEVMRQTNPQPADDGTKNLAMELAATKAERDALARERHETAIDQQVRAAAGNQWVDANLAVQLIRQNVRVVDGRPVVVDPATGQERLNASLEPMTLTELAREMQASRPYLVRSEIRGGSGSYESTGRPPAMSLDKLFGKGSDAAAANRLALKDRKTYLRMREAARQKGLIP